MENKMRKLISALLIIIMAFTASACGKSENTDAKSEASATNVTAYTAIKKDISQDITYTGELKAGETASVTCMASAKIVNVLAEVGDYVTKGTALATLDTQQLRLQYEQAKAAYNQALASFNSTTGGATEQQKLSLEQSLSSAKIAYNTALDNYNREKSLFDIGATSELSLTNAKNALDNAKLALDTAQKNYDLTISIVTPETSEVAKAAVDSAKAAVALAQTNLNNASVIAPISGYVASRNINKGQVASPGVELFSIKNTSSFNAEISVTESVISSVKVGTPALVSVKSAGLSELLASVSVVNPTKNPQTGLYTVRVTVESVSDSLKEGMFADICLKTEEKEQVICVPLEAIMQENEEFYVYVISGDTAEKRLVETGISDTEFTEILSGVNENEQIVVSGKEYISENNNQVKITGEY